MKPFFQAVLDYYAQGHEASRQQLQDALRADYGNFKAFKDHALDGALQTAYANGMIDESRYELDDNGELIVYYKSDQDMINTIRSYIK